MDAIRGTLFGFMANRAPTNPLRILQGVSSILIGPVVRPELGTRQCTNPLRRAGHDAPEEPSGPHADEPAGCGGAPGGLRFP